MVPQLGFVLAKPSCIWQQGAWTDHHMLLTLLHEAFVRATQVKHRLLGEHLGRPSPSLLRMMGPYGQRIALKLVPKRENLGFRYSFYVGYFKIDQKYYLDYFFFIFNFKL